MTEKSLTLENYNFNMMILHYMGKSINISYVFVYKRINGRLY